MFARTPRRETPWPKRPWPLRHKVLGALALGLLVFIAGHALVKNSGAYEVAVTAAHASPAFVDALGDPITQGWFVEAQFEFGKPATATLVIPVVGQRRRGDLKARARRDPEGWKLMALTLELAQPDATIQLLAPNVRGTLDPAVPE